MTGRRSTKRRPRIVGVIASREDLEQALRMRRPPDLFELRLDHLAGIGTRPGHDLRPLTGRAVWRENRSE